MRKFQFLVEIESDFYMDAADALDAAVERAARSARTPINFDVEYLGERDRLD